MMENRSKISQVWCNYCLMPKGWRLLPHVHEDRHELYLITRGVARARIGREAFEGHVGDVLFHLCGLTHYPESVGSTDLGFLHLRWSGGDEYVEQWKQNPVHDRRGHVRHVLEWMLDLFPPENAHREAQLSNLCEAALQEVTRLQAPAESILVDQVRRYVRNNISEPITLDDLAREAHLSKCHFARTFKDVADQSPMRFVTEMRITTICEMLCQTNMTLEAMAEETGMGSASHLIHAFKRQTGMTPTAYRKRQQV
jgi:AraC-like DNA-binding protein